MKESLIAILGLGVGANVAQAAEEQLMAVKDLKNQGVSAEVVLSRFFEAGVTLNQEEMLKVSFDEEGKNFKFETLDHLSISVELAYASVIGKKDL